MMTPETRGQADPGPRSVGDVKAELGPKLCALLTFTKSKNLLRIKPKEFLGKATFADVAERIRSVGGSYSKEEHLFKVWLVVGKKPPTRRPRRRALKDLIKDLQGLVTELEAWVE